MKRPKIYCDTSLIVDYLIASGREPEACQPAIPEQEHERIAREYWQELFNHNKRYNLGTQLRSLIGWQNCEVDVVVSPFVLLELDAWYAEESFKQHAVEGTHFKAIQSLSRKRIGELLHKVYQDQKDVERTYCSNTDPYCAPLWAAVTSRNGDALDGIEIEGVEAMCLDASAFRKVSLLAILQMGMADIVHLLAADHLECDYLATTDDDFHRLRNEIETESKLGILYKQEIAQKLREANKAEHSNA